MNYQEALDYLYAQLPMFQRLGVKAFKADLSNTLELCKRLDHPEQKFKSIHVGGTNGKGSVSHMLAAIFQSAGYKTGLHTSPHLKDFRERIRINGIPISENDVIQFVEQHRDLLQDIQPSFFEYTVGMAFDYFAKENVDIAIIEVGMGGRLDSTNVITPELSVITNIGKDHTAVLGNTYAKIATEKAGIIKEGVPVVIGQTHPETVAVFNAKALENNSPIQFADQLQLPNYETDLLGSYQKHNMKTAVTAINRLIEKGYAISEANIAHGLNHVQALTGLMGRWQLLNKEPFTVADTAHNVDGLSYTMKQFQQVSAKQLHIVFGVVNDKDLDEILPLLPKDAIFYLCKPNVPRGLDEKILKAIFDANHLNNKTYPSVKQALENAQQAATIDDAIYIGGSTFVVAEILS
ncbi:MAG: tetrahydrofolate synthase [Crocinitomicaceae bacterium]|nr:tetrahydrofolate synthase [Crocinitomicaceae bacterium]|tara:strand:+ start:1735 stop:2955 length:1221 start_codon:yes stop_codon:yes gene_type:complete